MAEKVSVGEAQDRVNNSRCFTNLVIFIPNAKLEQVRGCQDGGDQEDQTQVANNGANKVASNGASLTVLREGNGK